MPSTIEVSIDKKYNQGRFTNFDSISGLIRILVQNAISLNDITVKLEGVSFTQIQVPREELHENRNKLDSEKRKLANKAPKSLTDTHKVLYLTEVVFPPSNVRQVLSSKEFTLAAGTYTYPFEFKIPLNNACSKTPSKTGLNVNGISNLNLNGGVLLQNSKFQNENNHDYHVTSQLPPSFTGGANGSIKYFVKVTAKRLSILKMNLRHEDPFLFMPMDVDSRGNPMNLSRLLEVYLRKEVPLSVSQNQPQQPSRRASNKGGGFILRFFGKPSYPTNPTSSFNPNGAGYVQRTPEFLFEVRLGSTAILPGSTPDVRLYVVSRTSPLKQALKSSNVWVNVSNLRCNLDLKTTFTACENHSTDMHRALYSETLEIFRSNGSKSFDLSQLQHSGRNDGLWELPIGTDMLQWTKVPDDLPATFYTCNIDRRCVLHVNGTFSDYKNDQVNVQLAQEVKILTGFGKPQPILPEHPEEYAPMRPTRPGESIPTMPARPSNGVQKPGEYAPFIETAENGQTGNSYSFQSSSQSVSQSTNQPNSHSASLARTDVTDNENEYSHSQGGQLPSYSEALQDM